MSALVQKLTPGEYLAIERKSEIRHEYYAGEMFAMSGASRPHNVISVNFVTALNQALRDRPCEAYTADMRVRVPTGLYTYPDVVVACDPQFEDAEVDTLLNPVVIVEVLAESTAGYDRGTKFKHYRAIESIREIILVEQSSPQLERWALIDGVWQLEEVIGLEKALRLTSIGVEIPLSEIFRKVDFAENP